MIDLISIVFLLALSSSAFGCYIYKKFAIRFNIVSELNSRTLHEKPTPRGGGIVFGLVFICVILYLYAQTLINESLFKTLVFGGLIALIVGYIDDIFGISAIKKLFCHMMLSLLVIIVFGLNTQISSSLLYSIIVGLPTLFLLVWLINVFNFIDGIDGMAISAAILLSSTILLTIFISNKFNNFSDLVLILLTLVACCFGFMFFNWPKASIFMGDSGSIFLGYSFGVFIIYSITVEKLSIFTWLVVLSYYLADTSITTFIRIIKTKKWYGTHRSHAYQNLARVLKNHSKVTNAVIIYHLLWLMPLAVSTVLLPNLKFIAVLFAFLPSVAFTYKYGPLFSSD